jgi:hypothetical protein
MVVESAPVEGSEDQYNSWYSGTHIPQILEIPGFQSAQRYRISEAGPAAPGPSKPRYLTIYALEADNLADPVAELRSRSAHGRMERSDALALSPPPVVTIYELLEQTALRLGNGPEVRGHHQRGHAEHAGFDG